MNILNYIPNSDISNKLEFFLNHILSEGVYKLEDEEIQFIQDMAGIYIDHRPRNKILKYVFEKVYDQPIYFVAASLGKESGTLLVNYKSGETKKLGSVYKSGRKFVFTSLPDTSLNSRELLQAAGIITKMNQKLKAS